jgi:hypothetical protein
VPSPSAHGARGKRSQSHARLRRRLRPNLMPFSSDRQNYFAATSWNCTVLVCDVASVTAPLRTAPLFPEFTIFSVASLEAPPFAKTKRMDVSLSLLVGHDGGGGSGGVDDEGAVVVVTPCHRYAPL